ncbi:MAG TPA: cyclopropane-fatty-acyl-phospholipid synthase family protein [Aggregatilineales bacterium]|nr:class I SAM-dependent methyltransferase [Anaerolineales bacterium]HRE47467.1 cyclopropane-fatty-acyl-phospholipid synthase family protein [Aggregatilineales bacterium]
MTTRTSDTRLGAVAAPATGKGAFLRRTATKLLRRISEKLPDLSFTVRFWDGTTEQFGKGCPAFSFYIKTLEAAQRVLRDGGLGFGEEHMDGTIDIEGDLGELLKLQYTNAFDATALTLTEKFRAALTAFIQRNSLTRVRKNVAHHYDLSYDFYKLWLDQSMTYTCAYFRHSTDTLEQAQANKHEHICRKLRLEPGMSLVDIGCGWGAMMFYAAEHYAVRCVGYTISQEQHKYLTEQIERRGMRGKVEVRLQDYREAKGQFDRWVSIGMFEQVGSQYVNTFMDRIVRILKPGGIGLLHTIAFRTRNLKVPWMTRYIFPGGFLPSLGEIVEPMSQRNLNIYDVEDLRLHYGETLDHWDNRFCQHLDDIRAMYGERFIRMWRLYLKGAASFFRYGGARLNQLAFVHGTHNQHYRTRAYLYGDEPEQFNLPNISKYTG